MVLVTGSQEWKHVPTIWNALDVVVDQHPDERIVVLHGGARGADRIADWWVTRAPVRHPGRSIDRLVLRPDWDECVPLACPPYPHRGTRRDGSTFCKLAGFRRNQQLVDQNPSHALAFRLDGSGGTTDCVRRIQRAHIPYRLIDRVSEKGGDAA